MPKVKIIANADDKKIENFAVKKETVKIMPKRKIMFAASECTPFISTGGLSEVIGSLSKSLAQDESYDVRVVLPLYSDIRGDYRQRFKYLGNLYVPLGWRNRIAAFSATKKAALRFIFSITSIISVAADVTAIMTTASGLRSFPAR